MIFVSALIFCGIVSCGFGQNSCNKCTDYNFYMVEKLVEDVEERIHFLKKNLKDGEQTHCPNMTCPKTSCSDGWVSYKESCYFFENTQTWNFQESGNFCKEHGAYLVHVDDEAENDFIVGMIKRFKQTTHWHIGLTDQGAEGVWKLIDTNTTTDFLWWSPGQPDGGTEQNCVVYYSAPPYRWHDSVCTSKFGLICEKMLE